MSDNRISILPTGHESDYPSIAGKMLIVWVSTITGITITEWAALFAILYTLLQIFILIRDKIWRDDHKKKP